MLEARGLGAKACEGVEGSILGFPFLGNYHYIEGRFDFER